MHLYTRHFSCAFDFNVIILKGLTIVKPVIYGNISRYFGKKRDEDGHTHQWTVYVKPYKNEVLLTLRYLIHKDHCLKHCTCTDFALFQNFVYCISMIKKINYFTDIERDVDGYIYVLELWYYNHCLDVIFRIFLHMWKKSTLNFMKVTQTQIEVCFV